MKTLFLIFKHDLLIAYRQMSDSINPLIFFLIVISLFPLAMGASPKTLASVAPAIIWVAALLAILLGLTHLFRDEYREGSLEQLLLREAHLSSIILMKVFAHWCITVFPMIVFIPVIILMLGLSFKLFVWLSLSLLLGTPTLSLIGSIGAALTIGLRNQSVLIAIIILPLFIPVLIFATQSIIAVSSGMAISGQLAILGALLAFALTFAPLVTAAALKVML